SSSGSSVAMKRVRTRAAVLGALLAASTAAACSTGTSAAASKPQERGPAPLASSSQASEPAPSKKLGTPQPKLPVGQVVLETPPRAPVTLKVEVASSDAQRQAGLMFRESMGDDEGMLFLFSTERHNSFWMHNTLIPLDMLFIDSEWKVVGVVEQATPQTDDPRNVPGMSQYVLEVNGGFAARHGLGTETQVRFTPPPETPQ
ncbi:MAG: hypothetical protein JWN04_4464, partial [Myxococcaceae bacterium]|nr:hypothetical protein [Myxococcaceae bacterium]